MISDLIGKPPTDLVSDEGKNHLTLHFTFMVFPSTYTRSMGKIKNINF